MTAADSDHRDADPTRAMVISLPVDGAVVVTHSDQDAQYIRAYIVIHHPPRMWPITEVVVVSHYEDAAAALEGRTVPCFVAPEFWAHVDPETGIAVERLQAGINAQFPRANQAPQP